MSSTKKQYKMYKVVLQGDSRVGKTSIRLRYLGKGFSFTTLSTLGTEFSLKQIGTTKLQIWDLAGVNDFSFLRKSYYTGAHGSILVFDLSNPSSFESLDKWIDEIHSHLREYIPMILVGNKADLLDTAENTVSPEDIENFLGSLRSKTGLEIPYFQSSALTGLNIEELFGKMLEEISY